MKLRREWSILIVDDNDLNLKVMCKAIEHTGLPIGKILTANNGRIAFEICQKEFPSIIITDWEMPQLDGIGLVRILKADDTLKHIPVLMMTAVKKSYQNLYEAFETGAVDYLNTPIDPIELKARLRTVIQLIQYIREIKIKEKMMLRKDQHLTQARLDKLNAELELQYREAAASVGFLMQIEKEKEKFTSEFKSLQPYLNKEGQKKLRDLLDEYSSPVKETLLSLKSKFDSVNTRFYSNLLSRYPELSHSEKELCAYILLDLSPREIAQTLQKNQNATNVSLSRLRSKLHISTQRELRSVLKSLE